MKTYELSGESRCTINGETLFTSHSRYFFDAKNEKEAIEKFKATKGNHIKKIKAKEVK